MTPSRPPPLIAAAIFRNIFLDARGDLHRVAALIETMQEQLLQTTRCQVARLQLISKRDAFLNAFVATNTTVQCLLMELRRRLHEELAAAPVPKQSE